MKLFGRQNKTVEVPPELQPYYEGSTGVAQPALWRWGRWVVLVLLLAAIGAAVYFLGPWGSSNNKTATTTSGSHSTTSPNKGQTKTPTAPPTSGKSSNGAASSQGSAGKPSSNAPSAPAPSQGATNQNSSQSGNQKLTNTGPGDTVALFVITALVGSIGYELYQHRRATD